MHYVSQVLTISVFCDEFALCVFQCFVNKFAILYLDRQKQSKKLKKKNDWQYYNLKSVNWYPSITLCG